MLYTFTCSPRQSMFQVSTPSRIDKNYARVTRSSPPTSRFFTKRVIFLCVRDTVVRVCIEIKLNHAKKWNPSLIQQPGWSWEARYDSFRGMIFPGNMKWMITEPREGTGVSWCRYESQPLIEPMKQVLEICSLISTTLLRTLLLTNTNQNQNFTTYWVSKRYCSFLFFACCHYSFKKYFRYLVNDTIWNKT